MLARPVTDAPFLLQVTYIHAHPPDPLQKPDFMEQDLNVWRRYMSARAAARAAKSCPVDDVEGELKAGREWLKIVGELTVETVSIDEAEKTTLREWLAVMVCEQPAIPMAA